MSLVEIYGRWLNFFLNNLHRIDFDQKKHMKKNWILLIITSTLFSQTVWCQSAQTSQSLYKVIYEADNEGNRLSGDLDLLIELVNNGNPVRVGWELIQKWPDSTTVMTHWTDGGFVTTQRGHVFAQIEGIFGQGVAHISSETPAVFLSTAIPNSWVAVIGTTGVLTSKFAKQDWMNDLTDEQIKSMETMKVKTKWAVMLAN